MTTPKDESGLHMTTDPDVRAAIAKYGAEIADGEITFGPEGFANTYPGREDSERALGHFVASHVREL
jgi:hypothetical protein